MFEYVLTQNNPKQGLKIYGERGGEATLKELTQIHNMDALIILNAETLSGE